MKDRIKKTGLFVLMLAAVGFVFFRAGVQVGAADSEPGGVGDPLVSKSYLDSRLNELSGVMNKVTLSKDSVLTAAEGATVVVFSGNGTVSGSGAGLVNVTAGELTSTGISLAKYNTYLFPDAATGIKADSMMVVFVTGTYQITQ
ncbi:MAG: hypothetical protein NC086_00365 [Alistipes sp.]|nr:hypothetical protein [Alistipes sp.]